MKLNSQFQSLLTTKPYYLSVCLHAGFAQQESCVHAAFCFFFFPYSAIISHVDEVFVTTMFNHTTTSTWVLKRFTQMFPFNIFATVDNAEISYLMEMTYIFFSSVEFFL